MDRGTPSMGMTRREWLKYTTIAGAAATVGGRAAYGAICGDSPVAISTVHDTGCGIREEMPLSPLVLEPWKQNMPVPQAMRPGWRRPDGSLDPNAGDAWTCRTSYQGASIVYPGKEEGHQDSFGHRTRGTNLPYRRNASALARHREHRRRELACADLLSHPGASFGRPRHRGQGAADRAHRERHRAGG